MKCRDFYRVPRIISSKVKTLFGFLFDAHFKFARFQGVLIAVLVVHNVVTSLLPTCLCWVACFFENFPFTSLSIPKSSTELFSPIWDATGAANQEKRNISFRHTVYFVFVLLTIASPPPQPHQLTEKWLTTSQKNFPTDNSFWYPPSLFCILVFCKVYSGKSEKSEPFSLFYITKTN